MLLGEFIDCQVDMDVFEEGKLHGTGPVVAQTTEGSQVYTETF